jgi:hypothetical protein
MPGQCDDSHAHLDGKFRPPAPTRQKRERRFAAALARK